MPEERRSGYGGHDFEDDWWVVCSCNNEDDRKCCNSEPEIADGKRWCADKDGCSDSKDNERGKKCGCHLFKLKGWKEGTKWVHVADPGDKVDAILEPDYIFRCICVRKK